MLKGLFGLTLSHRFLYLQITLELEPISKMWIRVQVEPVELLVLLKSEKSLILFFGQTGSTGQQNNALNLTRCSKGYHSCNSGAVRNNEARP